MWILDRILKKKEVQQEAPKEETIDEILAKVEELKKKETARISAEASAIIGEIAIGRKSLIDIINEIKSSEVASMEDRVKNVTETARQKFISALSPENIFIPEEVTLSSLKDMNASLAELFKTVAVNRKNFYYISIAFPEKMKDIKQILVSLENSAKAIKTLAESDIFRKAYLIKEQADVIQDLESKDKKIEDDVKNIRSEITTVKDRSERAKKTIEDLKISKDYIEYINSTREMDELEAELDKIKTIILTMLSPLHRPLKKFEKIVDIKKKSELINSFLENPLIIIEKHEELKEILSDLLDALEKDKISMDGKEKCIACIKNILETNDLSDNILRYQELIDEIDEQEKDFPVLRKIDELKKEIINESRIPNLEKDASDLERMLTENRKTIADSNNKIREISQSI